MEDNLYHNKFAVEAGLGMIKVAKKAARLNAAEEIAKLQPEIEEYKVSKEYKALQDEIRKKDDDDDIKIDTDPRGYELYEKFVSIFFII